MMRNERTRHLAGFWFEALAEIDFVCIRNLFTGAGRQYHRAKSKNDSA
jgi:hypothetical protein